MPNTNSDLSSAHVTIAASSLEEVRGGAGLGAFPASDVGTAAGQGITETYKQSGNIGNAINSFNQSGYNPIYNGLSAAKSYFSNNAGSTYTPATSNGNGPVTPGTLTPPGQ